METLIDDYWQLELDALTDWKPVSSHNTNVRWVAYLGINLNLYEMTIHQIEISGRTNKLAYTSNMWSNFLAAVTTRTAALWKTCMAFSADRHWLRTADCCNIMRLRCMIILQIQTPFHRFV